MTDYFHGIYDISPGDVIVQKNVKAHFMALFGVDLDYYGADSAEGTFKIDDVVFKVLEDPDDGYRSHLGVIDYSNEHSSIFFEQPVAKVRIEEFDDGGNEAEPEWARQMDHGYRLIDTLDKHVWLEFGTANYDDYYPYFMFRHYPKKKK